MSKVCVTGAADSSVGPAAEQIEIEHQAPRAGDLRHSSADISRARAVLGYDPRVPLAEGLAQLVESLRAGQVKAA